MKVKLQVAGLKDFQPESIAEQVPELKKLLELRNALKSLGGPLTNVPEFRKKLSEIVKDEETRKRVLKELGIEG
jgi:type VI secretion system protein ImpB